jgi:hypothetical protein
MRRGRLVSHVLYLSYSKNFTTDSSLTTAKRTVERHLMHSGMIYTILRPGCFMEVWLSPAVGFDYPSAKATIYGAGRNPLSWISRGDVAAYEDADPAMFDVIGQMAVPFPTQDDSILPTETSAPESDTETPRVEDTLLPGITPTPYTATVSSRTPAFGPDECPAPAYSRA